MRVVASQCGQSPGGELEKEKDVVMVEWVLVVENIILGFGRIQLK